MPRAGLFRHALSIYKREPSESGAFAETFVAAIRARKQELRGLERMKDAATRSDKTATWTTYYRSDILPAMIAKDQDGLEYEINSVLDETGMRRELQIVTTQRD